MFVCSCLLLSARLVGLVGLVCLSGVCSVFVVGSDEGLTAVPYSNDGLHTIQFWE